MRKRRWIGGFILNGLYWVDRFTQGRRHRFSTRCKTLPGALRELEAWESDPSRNYRPGSAGRGGGDLEGAMSDYLKASAARNSKAHVSLQAAALQRWRGYLGSRGVSSLQGLTAALAANYIPWRKEGGQWLRRGSRPSVKPYPGGRVGDAIVNRDLAALKALMTWAREVAQIVPDNFDPLKGVKFLKEHSDVRPHRDVEKEHIEAVISKLAPRWGGAVWVLYGTGLRYDSFARLREQDIDLEAQIIRDPYPKGKVAVEVPASRFVLGMAVQCLTKKYPRDHASQLDRRLRTACQLAGVPRFTAHDLRVSTATFWHRSGVPVGDIQRLLGHSEVRTTMRYIRASRKPVVGPI
jgi:integrase